MDHITTIDNKWMAYYDLATRTVHVETPTGERTVPYCLNHEPVFGYDVADVAEITELAVRLVDTAIA